MSKSKAKPVLSEEERRARMAALTSNVAAVNLLDGGRIPTAAPAATPAPAAPASASASTPAPEISTLATAPATDGGEQAGKRVKAANETAALEPVTAVPVPAAATPVPAAPAAHHATYTTEAAEEEPAGGVGEGAAGAPAPAAATGELNLEALFAPATEKKDTTLRITAAHQQFFNQLGVVLGHGASAPDIIHNILTQFRSQHEAALARLVRRALAKQFK